MYYKDFNKSAANIKKENKSLPMSTYCRKIAAKVQPNGSNILIKTEQGDDIRVFIPVEGPVCISGTESTELTLTCPGLDASMYDLPVKKPVNVLLPSDNYDLPNESQNSLFNITNDDINDINETVRIAEDDYVECPDISEYLMVLLTELCDWGDSPNFQKYKRDSSDPVFDILERYYDDADEKEDEDYYVNIPSKTQQEVKFESTTAINKRKRKAKLYLDEYYCEVFAKTKRIKLNSSRKKATEKPLDENITQIKNIILGPNGTQIKAAEFNTIKWNSASSATRKLLSILFSPEILATHSLTGRPSPAFIDRERPLKQPLNSEIIQDLIYIVQSNTHGSEREIRAAITTKCADAAKMIRASSIKKENSKLKLQN